MKKQSGFTLVELMISLVLAALISIILFTVMRGQQRSFKAQTEVSQIQQTIRATMDILTRDLMNLGVDPTESGNYGIYRVGGNQFNDTAPDSAIAAPGASEIELLVFTSDLNENGGVANTAVSAASPLLETFSYKLVDCDFNAPAAARLDWDNADGDNDHATGNQNDTDCLRRYDGQPVIADNIQGMEINFLDNTEVQITPVTAADRANIAFAEINMLVRSATIDPDHINTAANSTYTCPASGTVWGPYNDSYRRRFVTTLIRLRNTP